MSESVVSGKSNSVSFVPANASSPISERADFPSPFKANMIFPSLPPKEESLNACSPIVTTEEGIVIFLIAVPANALSPMVDNPSGSETSESFTHPLKAAFPMLSLELLIVTVAKFKHFSNALVPIDETFDDNVKLLIPVPLNAKLPIDVTDEGTLKSAFEPSNVQF